MLSLLLLLSGLARLTAPSGPHSQKLQITVPHKVESDTEDGDAQRTQKLEFLMITFSLKTSLLVTYVIDIEKKSYTLHLEKQSLLDPNFLAYSYNKLGTLSPESSLLKNHCFYEGYAAEVPKSIVVLSACSGLRGLLQFENVTYVMEPLEYIPTYVHILYQIRNNNIDHSSLPESSPVTPPVDQSYRIHVKQQKHSLDPLLTRTLKIQIIMDKGLYEYMGFDMTLAAEKVVFIFHLMNTMFSQLKVNVMLSSMEAWSDQNKIPTNGDADDVLKRFLSWKENVLFQRSHDMAYLLIYRDHPDYVGAAYHGMACNPKFAVGIALVNNVQFYVICCICYLPIDGHLGYSHNLAIVNNAINMGVQITITLQGFDVNYFGYITRSGIAESYDNSYPKTITIEAFSVILVQLLGINLGLTYDNIYNCHCPGTTCIMNPEAIHSSGIKPFSSCSVDELKRLVSRPELGCLQNQTVSKVVYEAQSGRCGNGSLESSEECDCGLQDTCKYKKCCDPKTCFLIGSAECGTGPCCNPKTCSLLEQGNLCRKSVDQCDFPEFCDGLTEACVQDTKAADFEPCSNHTAYCYKGRCRDTDLFCMKLHGKFAQGGTDLCTMEINFQNDDFGNCQGRKCDFNNIICGKVVCEWKSAEVVSASTQLYNIQYTYLSGHTCISAQFRVPAPPGAVDKSQAANGLKCEDGKFCLNGICEQVSHYVNKTLCNSAVQCQGHGVCNNFHNCHCDVGYTPPSCDPTPSSPGGSIDDGFWYQRAVTATT